VTTVTVAWDLGALDHGLSAVSTGILTSLHSALPAPPVYISNYASLPSAVAAIGTAPMNLLVNVPTAVTAATTVPANISIGVAEGGLITQAGGSLTINGPFHASGQAFSGFGGSQVVWGSGAVDEVKAAWFYSGSGAWDSAVQAAHDSVVASALPLAVKLPALCTLTTGVSINLSYASLKGRNTIIDATGLTTGAAITVTGSVNPPYTQSMNHLEGFRLRGATISGTTGILFQNTGVSGAGPGHISLSRVQVDYFDVGLSFFSNAYNISCYHSSVVYCNTLISIPSGGTNYGNEIRFFGGEFYGAMNWYVNTAGGNGQDIYFIGSSFLYANGSSTTARLFNLDGYKMYLYGCHIELNAVASLDAAIEVFGANGTFTMYGGYLAVGATGSNQYIALISINNQGSNRCGVVLDGLYVNVSVSSDQLIANVGNALSFVNTARLDFESPGSLLPLISQYMNVMNDGGFETTTSYFLDNIFVVADGGGITGRVSSSTVSAALSTAQHHSGAQSLAVTKTSGASAVGAVAIVIPIRQGERPFFELWAQCSQTFTIQLQWYSLYFQGGVNGLTAMGLNQVQDIADASISATSWTLVNAGLFELGGGYYGTLPPAPPWVSHFAIVIQMYPVNNGTAYIDDLKVNIVK
jgi:hypothetical protein